ncbi:2-polyprenyl-3-methyl-6-methoxy-1,4-benzoquinone monooxygenase [Caballeronia mineralivorans]|jgi:ubiquinone biosynthesis monooxygenase Coq7|uniref:2-polyprenyl-3-methyl-6-methoxy-1,4-benzoquinone monooxygenase n=1 Tax=Caballeronia mineralivorans TaxID=2010198 RepID=UPI0023F229F4|nr:2-polyprenyl-3-methyl-6-methoxy-1,4-benzoquinone monooxygenase [Caballeronia mineralivorans]MDB5783441.1 2-octaprenyl-3-methyl-6-methoxy,4-benzoquinol hydroxylase [Caballeronia mineralivorans]MEA3102031.1 3-demethoxyubiquinol 3-hydroxylase [Caballeronia mineralivorans]
MTLDELISEFDRGLRSMTGVSRMSRPIPAPQTIHADDAATPAEPADTALTVEEKAHSAALMRVNHVGEVCAQALYQAQKLATKSATLKRGFEQAAREEEDHLAWTTQRLRDLDSRPSLLNPLWYTGSLALGFVAGRFGDRVSLGFMAETERQVEKHLNSHMTSLPANDHASRAIVEQMRVDEAAHAVAAVNAGGIELPFPVRALMRATSKVMTRTAYYI